MRSLTAPTLALVASSSIAVPLPLASCCSASFRAAMELDADGPDAGGDLVGRVQIDVVGANQHDDYLRAHVVELAVREPPDDVLGAVPAVAKVHDTTTC